MARNLMLAAMLGASLGALAWMFVAMLRVWGIAL